VDPAQLESSDAGRMDALAEALETGLAFHRSDGGGSPADCPLCGAPGTIDEAWVTRAREAASDVRRRSGALRDAHTAVGGARRAVVELFARDTAVALARASEPGVRTAGSTPAWTAWRDAVAGEGSVSLAAARERAVALALALQSARTEAARVGEDRARAWRSLREATIEWVARATRAASDSPVVITLKAAERWMGETIAALRRERLAPVVDGARANWAVLRHESNVALGGVELKKVGTERFASFDVAIDGRGASAFGVMSQGEQSALAISVFLPRAMLPGSPFGFVVIDDPVQSMDPAKVVGLAPCSPTPGAGAR
jgi:hypothetical protein